MPVTACHPKARHLIVNRDSFAIDTGLAEFTKRDGIQTASSMVIWAGRSSICPFRLHRDVWFLPCLPIVMALHWFQCDNAVPSGASSRFSRSVWINGR
jgi:hypothetical protein